MTQHALYVQLEAKPGKEQEVVNFLSSARTMVRDEPETTAWFDEHVGLEDVRSDAIRRRSCPGENATPICRAGASNANHGVEQLLRQDDRKCSALKSSRRAASS